MKPIKKQYPIQCPYYACGERGKSYYCYFEPKEKGNHCSKLEEHILEITRRNFEDFINRARENGAI